MSETRTEILKAFIKAKGEFPEIKKTKTNPFFKSKYAPLEVILAAVEPVLLANGLLLQQHPEGDVIVTTLYHAESGESMPEGRYPLHAVKEDPQSYAAANTYGRRYSILTYLGLAAEDDDGNSASGSRDSSQKDQDAPNKPPTDNEQGKGTGSADGGMGKPNKLSKVKARVKAAEKMAMAKGFSQADVDTLRNRLVADVTPENEMEKLMAYGTALAATHSDDNPDSPDNLEDDARA